jgi:hypothetical protein
MHIPKAGRVCELVFANKGFHPCVPNRGEYTLSCKRHSARCSCAERAGDDYFVISGLGFEGLLLTWSTFFGQ